MEDESQYVKGEICDVSIRVCHNSMGATPNLEIIVRGKKFYFEGILKGEDFIKAFDPIMNHKAKIDTIILIKDSDCPKCKGSGHQKYCDAAGSSDTKRCPQCNGLGWIAKDGI